MEFVLTTLGIASALPTISKYPSAHVLNIRGRLFLIDCGEGCQMLLRKHNFSILKFDDIFISHFHGDHIFGLFGLLSTMDMMGRTANLTIHAPKGLEAILDFYKKEFGDGLKYKITHDVLDSEEPRRIFNSRNIEAFAFPLNHRITTYGFLFKEKEPQLNVHKYLIDRDGLTRKEIGELKSGNDVVREDGSQLDSRIYSYRPFAPRSFAYCSDTAPFPKLIQWIEGVDLLYHEATFGQEMLAMAKSTFHSTTLQTAATALEAGVGKLVIGHFSSRYHDLTPLLYEARTVFAETYLGEEGETFEIPLIKYS